MAMAACAVAGEKVRGGRVSSGVERVILRNTGKQWGRGAGPGRGRSSPLHLDTAGPKGVLLGGRPLLPTLRRLGGNRQPIRSSGPSLPSMRSDGPNLTDFRSNGATEAGGRQRFHLRSNGATEARGRQPFLRGRHSRRWHSRRRHCRRRHSRRWQAGPRRRRSRRAWRRCRRRRRRCRLSAVEQVHQRLPPGRSLTPQDA